MERLRVSPLATASWVSTVPATSRAAIAPAAEARRFRRGEGEVRFEDRPSRIVRSMVLTPRNGAASAMPRGARMAEDRKGGSSGPVLLTVFQRRLRANRGKKEPYKSQA